MSRNRNVKKIIQAAPFVMIAVMAAIYLIEFKDMTVEQLLKYTPQYPPAAAAALLLMFALKSLSFFFPMMLLFAATGMIFPLYIAIPLCIAGIIIMGTVPFFIGRYAEGDAADSLAKKHDKVAGIRAMGAKHQFSSAFFLRIISCLPYDIVSMTLGSMKYSYGRYLGGTVLGTAPGAILTAIMGSSITDPFSPEFIICASAELGITAMAVVITLIRRKHQKNKMKG